MEDSSFTKCEITAQDIFLEFKNSLTTRKDKQKIHKLITAIYFGIEIQETLYWVLAIRWVRFAKRIGIPYKDWQIILEKC